MLIRLMPTSAYLAHLNEATAATRYPDCLRLEIDAGQALMCRGCIFVMLIWVVLVFCFSFVAAHTSSFLLCIHVELLVRGAKTAVADDFAVDACGSVALSYNWHVCVNIAVLCILVAAGVGDFSYLLFVVVNI